MKEFEFIEKEPIQYPLREPFNNFQYGEKQNQYKKHLISLYAKEDTLEETQILLQDIYTPLELGSDKNDNSDKRIGVEDLLCRYQYIAISGEAGSGKSTITKFLSLATSANGTNKTVQKLGKRVVLPIILRELNFSKIDSMDSLFSQWIDNLNSNLKTAVFDREFFDFYIAKGWAIIILDGFDEIGTKQNKNLISWINSYITKQKLDENGLRTNIIITGRPTGFLSDVKYEKNFRKYYLKPYSQEQIEVYTDKYMNLKYSPNKKMIEERKANFLNVLGSVKAFNQLKTRPIYLMMLVYISEHKGTMPRSRILAYEQMVESYIHILDKQRNLDEKESKNGLVLPNWDFQDKLIILEDLAYKIHNKASNEAGDDSKVSQLQIEIHKDELKKYLQEIVDDEDEKLKSVDKKQNIDEIVEYYLSRSGLLVEPRDNYIQFSHLSFQEYLTASKIHRDKDDLDLIDYLKKEIFNKLDNVGFSEVAQLYFGIDSLKGGKNQSKIIEKIFKDSFKYHEFIYNLIFTTENRLKEQEELDWLKRLITLWINSKNVNSFYYLISKLEYDSKEYKEELLERIKLFIFNLSKNIIFDKKIEYDIFIKNLKQEKISKIEKMTNILFTGYFIEEFRTSFLTKEILNQFPKDMKESEFLFILEKYLPFNKNIENSLDNIIAYNITPHSFINSIGNNNLSMFGIFTKNCLYRDILKIQLSINQSILFLLTKDLIKTKIKNIAVSKDDYLLKPAYMDFGTHLFDKLVYDSLSLAESMRKSMTLDIGREDLFISHKLYASNINMSLNVNKAWKISRSLDKEKRNDLKIKIQLFNIYASSKLLAKEVNLDIRISKQEYKELYEILKNDPVKYFEKYNLNDSQKGEIRELFEESYLLKTMKYTLENSEYEEFDEDKAIEDFHNDIKSFNAKYGDKK